MPTPSNSIQFTHRELVEMMLRHAGITEGRWALLVNFGLAAGNAGPDDEHTYPTAFVPVQGIGLVKVEHPGPLVVDASTLGEVPTQKAAT